MTGGRELMQLRVDHRHGRRYAQVGDVLRDSAGSEALVVRVVWPKQGTFTASTGSGTAWLFWSDKRRRSKRSCSSLRQLDLVRIGEAVGPEHLHAAGFRRPRVGDVLRRRATSGQAVVIEVKADRARLTGLDTGRTSTRSLESLRWLDLVREGAP